MLRLLATNFLVALLWPTLNGTYAPGVFATGFVLGFIMLTIVERSYGKLFFHLAFFFVYVLYAILQSNLKLALLVLRAVLNPKTTLRPGIVAVPLTITNPFERALLASVITLTPGTLSVDLKQKDGADVLYVHTVDLHDADAFRTELKEQFEDRILYLHKLYMDVSGMNETSGGPAEGVE